MSKFTNFARIGPQDALQKAEIEDKIPEPEKENSKEEEKLEHLNTEKVVSSSPGFQSIMDQATKAIRGRTADLDEPKATTPFGNEAKKVESPKKTQKRKDLDPERKEFAKNAKRYDYCVQEGIVEQILKPVGMLVSHMKYFKNKDISHFVLDKIHGTNNIPYDL